jgi:hypothetical protein
VAFVFRAPLVSLAAGAIASAIALAPAPAHAQAARRGGSTTPLLLTLPNALVTPTASLPTASLPAPQLPPIVAPSALFSAPPSASGSAPADTPTDGEHPIDYDTPRYEPAGFPIVGGTSDIGVMGGGVFTLTRFDGGIRPYKWNMDLVASASEKQGPTGTEIAQQSYLWQWDVPGLYGGKLRLNPAVSYERTINQGYYGIGNATPVFPADVPAGSLGRYNEFIAQEARVREFTRIKITGPYDLMVATTYRWVSPETYAGSRLEQDAVARDASGAPIVRGLDAMSLAQLAVGVVYDTRDNEFFPHRGMYHQAGIKAVQGMPLKDDVRYVEAGAILAGFVPLANRVVVAARLLLDAQAGNVPFYDLSRAGPFLSYDAIGGAQGVRGVPVGRYAGLAKAIGNVEVRSILASFRALDQSLRVGGDAFFDAGRAFSDYTFDALADGRGLGLKYGAGGGAFLMWGEAAIFRVDVAYSPEAVAENPNLPVGIYVQDGMMF